MTLDSNKIKTFFEASAVVVIALMLVVQLVVINVEIEFQQKEIFQKKNSIIASGSYESDYVMLVENTTAMPGDTGHVVRVYGEWSEEIVAYYIELMIDTDVLYFGQGYANLDGCIGEGAEDFRVDRTGSCIRITVIYTWDFTEGNGIPAGEGCLVNLIFDVEEDVPLELTPITFHEDDSAYLDMIGFDLDPHYALTYDGHIDIGDVGADVVYVDDDFDDSTFGWGHDHFDSIQDGVDAVAEYGTVHVNACRYYERVRVNKTLDLLGENKETTIIENDEIQSVLLLEDDISFSGFTVSHGGDHSIGITIGYGVGIIVSDNIVINRDLGFNGISLISTSSATVIDNLIMECNDYGILLMNTSDNTIVKNTITNNKGGIVLIDTFGGCDNNVIYENNIVNNTKLGGSYGVLLGDESDENSIYHNNFINNNYNAKDYGLDNTWDNGYPSGGNYWDDYDGVDEDEDGIGDMPYDVMPSYIQDQYPFIEQNGWNFRPLIINALLEINESELIQITITSFDEPIQGVIVNFSDESYMTNVEGKAIFQAPLVNDDTDFKITAEKEGYSPESVWITVKNVELPKKNQLEIITVEQIMEGQNFQITIVVNDSLIDDVEITVGWDDVIRYTNENGEVSLEAPFVEQNTDYTITATHPDYISVTTVITVLNHIDTTVIRLISPNGNESWNEDQTIEWIIETSEVLTNYAVTIQYQYAYGLWVSIVEKLADVTSPYLWNTTTASDGYPYIIRVILKKDNDADGIYETFVSEDTSDAPFAIDNSLTSQGWIHGWITDNDSMPLEDAMVCIILMNINNIITSKCMFANETGDYRMSIHAGTYTVSAFKSGYQKTTIDGVKVWANETTEVNFTLQQGTSSDIDLFFLDENRDQINRAIREQQVGAEISIIKDVSGMQYEKHVLVYDSVTIFPQTVKEGQISLLVNGNEGIAGKTIVINLGENLVYRNEKLSIEYDGETISMADNLLDVLNANDDGAHPEYLITFGEKGVEIIISIPHYSEHEITIYSLAPEEFTLYTQLAVITAIIIIAMSAIVLFRKGKEE